MLSGLSQSGSSAELSRIFSDKVFSEVCKLFSDFIDSDVGSHTGLSQSGSHTELSAKLSEIPLFAFSEIGFSAEFPSGSEVLFVMVVSVFCG